jgi:CheY-like chemotaxis protein
MVKIGEHRTLQGFMAPTKLNAEQAHRLLVQALERVAPPDQCEPLLQAALRAADETAVPAAAGPLHSFLLGPLRDEVARAVGPAGADMLVKSLAPMLVHQAEQDRGREPEPGDPAGAQAGGAPAPGDPATVLIVDSDIRVRSQVARALQRAGYGAVSAADLEVALAMCVRYKPALIIAELEADSRDQEKFTALLQVAFGSEAPPVVTLTPDLVVGRGTRHSDHQAAKPIVTDELIAEVKRVLEQPEGRA